LVYTDILGERILGRIMGQSYIADEKENCSIIKMPIMATDCEYNSGLIPFSKIDLYNMLEECFLGTQWVSVISPMKRKTSVLAKCQ